jgi:hypothetical protein
MAAFTSACNEPLNEVSKTVETSNAKKSNQFFAWDVNEKTQMPAFQAKNGRLVFKNSFDFLQATRFAQKQILESMRTLQQQAGYQSLYQYKLKADENGFNLSDFPVGYADILNEKGEVQVGDTLVCYAADGFKYFIPNGDENLLASIKTNPAAIPLKYEYRPKQVGLPNSPWNLKNTKQTQLTFSPNTIDARYQKEYRVNADAGSRRKIVYEMAFYRDNWFAYSSYVSQTKLKLEYWSNGSSSWQPAGEVRVKRIGNLNADTYVFNNGAVFNSGNYRATFIERIDGGDLSQALLQGWTWGGLDNAAIFSTGDYDSYVDQTSHKNFGGQYTVYAQW